MMVTYVRTIHVSLLPDASTLKLTVATEMHALMIGAPHPLVANPRLFLAMMVTNVQTTLAIPYMDVLMGQLVVMTTTLAPMIIAFSIMDACILL